MFAPATDLAQTHADQLRRDAVSWRERRAARRGTIDTTIDTTDRTSRTRGAHRAS